MVNKNYIKELLLSLLNNTKNNDFSVIASSNSNNKSGEINFYTIYVYMKKSSSYLNFDIQNIYPLQHIIDGNTYIYNNLIYDEIAILQRILELLDINVSILSDTELMTKFNEIKSNHLDIQNHINSLKEQNEIEKNYVLENNIKYLLNELSKINLFIE